MKKINDYHFSYREKDGNWQLILSYKVGKKWKQKARQGFRTKREANESKADLLREAEKSAALNVDLEDITLEDFVERFFLPDREGRIEANTVRGYREAVKSIGPAAKMPIRKITYLHIAEAVRIMRDRGLKATTINTRLTHIKTVFSAAVKPYKIIPESPAADFRKLKKEKSKKVKALTRDQLMHLLNVLRGGSPQVYVFAAIAGLAGLRRGEVLALCWNDIDFKARTMSVTKQLESYRMQRKLHAKRTKSDNSVRVVPMCPQLVGTLSVYRAKFPRSIDGRLFVDSPSGLYNRLRKAIKDVYPDHTPHSLRHTFATLALKGGANIQTVAALIGDTPQTVMETYIHYTDDLRKEAADVLEVAFR